MLVQAFYTHNIGYNLLCVSIGQSMKGESCDVNNLHVGAQFDLAPIRFDVQLIIASSLLK